MSSSRSNTLSSTLFERAQKCIPGGVNSPVRSFKGVGGHPFFVEKGEGPYLYDVDGNRYVDYVGSWGPLLTGHADPKIIQAIQGALEKGLSFGAPTTIEIKLVEKILQLMPHLEMGRLVSSGTEACMTAIRLARGYTHRDKIIKFSGCYHGHADSLLVSAGSGALTLGMPSSPGIPQSFTEHTLLAEYNHIETVTRWFERFPNDIAAIIVEPVAGNMNCILPQKEFLPELKRLCEQYGALLIFDEVMTGFRIAREGAPSLFAVTPHLTTLGKIIGGGLPVGAVFGDANIMKHLAPEGPVYQAGTLSGNPIACTAGLALLEQLEEPLFYETLSKHKDYLCSHLLEIAQFYDIPLKINKIGGMFGLFFTAQATITDFNAVKACDVASYQYFFHEFLKEGIYFAPSAFEASFLSSKHTHLELEKTLTAFKKICEKKQKLK